VFEEPPVDANVVRTKWVLKAKKDATGKAVHYKAIPALSAQHSRRPTAPQTPKF